MPAYWRSNIGAIAQQDLPTILARAINRTTEEAQARARQRIHQVLTVRTNASAQFLERMLKIRPDERATPTRLSSFIRVEGPATKSRRGLGQGRTTDILLRHEGGADSRTGPLFIPSHAMRPTPTSVVPRSLYPVALGLTPRRAIEGGATAGKQRGKRRTFMLPGIGIFQREGPDDIQRVWHFVQAVHTPARLRLRETIQRTVQARMPVNVQGFATSMLRRRILRAARGPVRRAA